MTYATLKDDIGRKPVTICELELDKCPLTEGTAPCTSTSSGDNKCFNTYATCSDKTNYAGRYKGTAQAGGASTITLEAGQIDHEDKVLNSVIELLSGVGKAAKTTVSAYNTSTEIATVADTWASLGYSNPDSTTVYTIYNTLTHRHITPVSPMPKEIQAIPDIRSVRPHGTKLQVGSLAKRGVVRVDFDDLPHHDRWGIDDYIANRTYDALTRGSYWSKLKVRNQHYNGRVLRLREGFLVPGTVEQYVGVDETELHTSGNAANIASENNNTTGFDSAGLNGTGANVFESTSSGTPNTGSYHLHTDANDTPTAGARIWMDLTTTLGLTVGVMYTLDFYWKHIGGAGDKEWSAVLGSDGGGANALTIGTVNTGNTTYVNLLVTFKHSANTRYLVFHESSANNNGGVYVDAISVKATTNEIHNGRFYDGASESVEGWTLGTGWSIGSGVLAATATTANAYQSVSMTIGKKYEVIYTISGFSAGSVRVQLGDANGTTRNADGTYTETITYSAGTSVVNFDGVSSFTGDIDNVSVKEVVDVDTYTLDVSTGSTDLQDRIYLLDKIEGPNSQGKVTVTAKDPLEIAKKAVAPAANTGTLNGAVNDSTTTWALTAGDGAQYSASGTGIMDSEIVTFTRSTDTLTVVRAQKGTLAKAHDDGALFQECLVSTSSAVDFVEELLNDYTDVSAVYIPASDWATEESDWLSGYNVDTVITKPTEVTKILSQLVESFSFDLFWDDVAQQIKLVALKPPQGTPTRIDDDSNIIEATASIEDDSGARISRVFYHYDIVDPSKGDDFNNYAKHLIIADSTGEGVAAYGEEKTKHIWARHVTSDTVASVVGNRYINRHKQLTIRAKVTCDIKDDAIAIGDEVLLNTRLFPDFTGAAVDHNMQVISINPKGDLLEIEMLSSLYSGGLYGYVVATAAAAKEYSAASTAEQEAQPGAGWIAPSTGKFSDDRPAYKIIG